MQTLAPMHEQVGFPSHPFGTSTQWCVPLSAPWVSMLTQVVSGPVQSKQLGTLAHWVAGTQGPQQPPVTLGTKPASQTGGSALQNT